MTHKPSLGIHCQDCVRDDRSETLIRFYLQSLSRDLLQGERVGECMRAIAPYKTNVEIRKRDDMPKAHYRNLVICSRIWQCAVCAATITEVRRIELTNALGKTQLQPLLVTYTLRHKTRDRLDTLLPALLQAFRTLKSGRAWQSFTSEYSWVGSVRALEVTHGLNGWHPHIHELVLLEVPASAGVMNGISLFLKKRWRESIAKNGHDASWERGVDVRDDDHEIRDYVAKFGRLPADRRWSIEHELTKAPSKRANKDGRTPMQLLADYGDGDKRAGFLFVEYAKAFKGRNQLVWSRGLRDMLGLGVEQSDEQLAENQAESGRLLATLTRSQWKVILSLNHRGQLLEFAANHDEIELWGYINDLLVSSEAKTSA